MNISANEWRDFFYDASKRHAQVFLTLLQSNDQSSSLEIELLNSETANIFTALHWSHETSQFQLFQELVDSLYFQETNKSFLFFLGKWIELRSWLEKAIEASKVTGGDENQARNLWRLGTVLSALSYFQDAQRTLEKSLEIYDGLGNPKGKASALINLGIVIERQGNNNDAQKRFEQALDIAKENSDQLHTANAAHQLGQMSNKKREFENAHKWYEYSLNINQEIGNKYGITANLHDLGTIAEAQNDLLKAREYYEASLRMSEDASDKITSLVNISQLASLEERMGNYQDAVSKRNYVLSTYKKMGDRAGEAFTLLQLSKLSHKTGDDITSERLLREGIKISEEIGDSDNFGDSSSYLVAKLRDQGKLAEARELLNKSINILEPPGNYKYVGRSYFDLGEINKKEGDNLQAKKNYLKALEIFKQTNDISIAKVLLALAEDDDSKKEAERVLLDLLEKTQDPQKIEDHIILAIGLALLYEKMDRHVDAVQILSPLREVKVDAYIKQLFMKVFKNAESHANNQK